MAEQNADDVVAAVDGTEKKKRSIQGLLDRLYDAVNKADSDTSLTELRQIAQTLIKIDPDLQQQDEAELPENPLEMVEHLCKVANLTPEEIEDRYGIGAVIKPVMSLFKISHNQLITWLELDRKELVMRKKERKQDEIRLANQKRQKKVFEKKLYDG